MLNRIKSKLKVQKHPERISFWFVRHGQREGNVLGSECLVMNDLPLTERGANEAKAIAKYLEEKGIKVTDIYTSPSGRSRQTAEKLRDYSHYITEHAVCVFCQVACKDNEKCASKTPAE